MDFPNWVQEIVTGAIVIAALVLDQLRHRGPEVPARSRLWFKGVARPAAQAG
jgi:ribose/xylose/arabinose/galactoside ABC-type transport system permease subunit